MTRAVLAPGDLVVDQNQPHDERGTGVVVRDLQTTADDHYVDSLDTTVAGAPGNESYPADDPVVGVIFAGHLDGNVPGWRAMLHDARTMAGVEFWDLLEDYREAWGVPLRAYAYPVSRLTPRPYCPDHLMRATRTDTGYVCPVGRCEANVSQPTNGMALNADAEAPRPDDGWDPDEVAAKSVSEK